MAVVLSQLCQYAKEDYGMRLLCGEKNFGNPVEWVHMMEDPDAALFLHGYELIFCTGIGHSTTDWLVDFVRRLEEHKASGLVLNLGPYIKEVPSDLIEFCKAHQFPLFTIPWETRIVDMTNDFCHRIVRGEENEIGVASAFKDAIFSPEKMNISRRVLEREGFDLDAPFCVVSISLKMTSIEGYSEYEKSVRLHLQKAIFKRTDRFSIFRQDRFLIVVVQDFTLDHLEVSLKHVATIVCSQVDQIYMGISGNEYGILSLRRSYKRAEAVMRLAGKQKKQILFYEDAGFYQLLIEVEDMKVLKKYYKNTLGPLMDYDRENDTDLLQVLRLYIEHDYSVEKVAKILFVHRNTVNYKIKRIKEVLQSELDLKATFELMTAFHIEEFL